MISYTQIPSPLGTITLSSDGVNLTGLWLEGQRYFPNLSQWEYAPELPVFADTSLWLKRYFAGMQPEPRELPLSPEGSHFQKQVWHLLLEIPYAAVTTYGALAKQLGCRSAQAIGGAVGRNPISIIIPCHRVVGQKGQLTGYAGGLDRKQWLLELENTK